jgi:KDO2-lipid IV(A) lauroyltransferase
LTKKPIKRRAGEGRTRQDWLVDRAFRAVLWGMFRLPYERRIALAGWLGRKAGAMAGHLDKAKANLTYIYPDMPEAERHKIALGVLDNTARSMIEDYDPPELLKRARSFPISGPGMVALVKAQANAQPTILVTGHYGNYEAGRAAITQAGHSVGVFYRPMNNAYFNAHYEKNLQNLSGPAFPRTRQGMKNLLKHLKAGGFTMFLVDQFMYDGAVLDFLGKPAPTALSAAEMALKFNALLIPFYGRRRADGISFDIIVEAPVPHSTPETMTQAVNDSLAAQIAIAPEQWLWTHRRWKPNRQEMRQRSQRAAKTGP